MDQMAPFDPPDLAPSPPQPSPFLIARPLQQTAPVVFASPHSGRDYPANFLLSARLDAVGLRRSEDCFVDELFEGATAGGAPLVSATFPRAFCDPNRERWELDPAMFEDALPEWVNTTSARVGAGLGTLARVVASGETIYRRKLSFREAEDRIRAYWDPYHAALNRLIEETTRRFDACLLVDCHSMPTQVHANRLVGPDIILGDAHGTACAPGVIRAAERILTELGFSVRRNDPYAGGYVTRHYGRPRESVHAIQIELARGLYMDEAKLLRAPGFASVQRKLSTFMDALCRAAPELLGVCP